mgnify:CR=1 FL=1
MANRVCKSNVKGDVTELLAKLVSQTDEAIVCVECDKKSIVLFNRGAEQLFGWDADEILGKDVITIMPHQARKESKVKAIGTRADGTKFPIEVSISTVDFNGKEYCATIVREIDSSLTDEMAELVAYRRTKKKQLLKEVGTIANLKIASRHR